MNDINADKTINELSQIEEVSEADTLPIWDDSLGGNNTKKVPVGMMMDSFEDSVIESIFSKYSKSDNSNYIEFPNGLLIQWGFEPTGSQQRVVNQKINFPIAFSNTNYSLTVTPNTWQSDTVHRIGWIGSNKLSTTQAWINFYGNGNQDTIDGMNWLAIGWSK